VRFLKNPAKKHMSIQQGMKLRKHQFDGKLSFILSACTAATRIFTAPN
jgi:hypothetical protein